MSLPSSLMVPIGTALTAMLVSTGRCSRKGLFVCALVLLGLQAVFVALLLALAIPHQGPAIYLVDAAFLWLGTCAAAKRLHDLGMSAFRILWSGLAVVAWSTLLAALLLHFYGQGALEPGGSAMTIAALGTSIPVFALSLWLHLAPGMPGPNRYGIAPGDSGFCCGMPLSGGVRGPAPVDHEEPAPSHGEAKAMVCARCEEAH